MRRWTFALALAALPRGLLAESPPIQPFTTADGLPTNQINQIVADSRGFIWFLTPEGLSRFDGHRIVNFGVGDGLPGQNAGALLETRSGEYLIGTDAGIGEFQAHGLKFATYHPGKSRAENFIEALFQDSAGRIWCATAGGLFEMLKDHQFRLEKLPPPPGRSQPVVTNLAEDSAHNLWVSTLWGVNVIGKAGVQHISLPSSATDNVKCLQADSQGRVWGGTQDGLVLMGGEVGRSRVLRIYKEIGGVRQLDISSLAIAPDGSLWAAASAGILRSVPGIQPEIFRLLTRAQGLTDHQINALSMDRAGNMWAGTEGAGVMKIPASGFTTFDERDGLKPDRVWSLLMGRDGTLGAVTTVPKYDWVNIFDGAKFHPLPVPVFSEHASWGHHILLQGRDGAWWAAAETGLYRYAPGKTATLAGRQPLVNYARGGRAYQIFEDSKGRIWAAAVFALRGTRWNYGQGSVNRVLCWDPATKTISQVEGGPNENEGVRAFAEDHDGNIWMSLYSSAVLLRYDGRQFSRYQRGDGLPEGPIFDLFTDSSGRLWVTSAHGLGVIEHPGTGHLGIRIYTTADGLATSNVFTIVEDLAGRIYAGSAKGVDRLDPRTGHIKHFSTADGLASGGITAAVRDRSGDLWFGTTLGISRLSPAADHAPSTPSVRVLDLRFGRDYEVSVLGETQISHADLQPWQNHLQASFVGFSDEPEANLRYKYKLEGGDSDWQGPGRDHEVNYPELTPGSYHFLVKAINSDGRESEDAARIDFVILPPVWRRSWFLTILAIALASSILAAYRWRLREMTTRVKLLYDERLDERTRIARELHDTLLQNLAGVSLQLEGVARQVDRSSETAASQIRTVRQQVDDSFTEARQKVLSLRSPMLQGRALPTVLRESLEKIVAGRPVRLNFTVSGETRPLRDEVDEAVLRIGQEAVANAVRHAEASEIQATLAYGRRSVCVRVEDNGRGFDLEEASQRVGHWGLRNMRERAQRIGAQWHVTTAPAHGTVIEAIVPLPVDNN